MSSHWKRKNLNIYNIESIYYEMQFFFHSLCGSRPQGKHQILNYSVFKERRHQNKYICCSDGRMTGISTLEQAVLPSVVCCMQSAGHRHTHILKALPGYRHTQSAVKVDATTLC